MLQHTSTTKIRSTKQDLYDSSVAVMLREMQRDVNTGHPFGSRAHIDYSTNNHPPQFHAADDLDCCFVAVLSWGKPVGPRIMRQFWGNITTGQSETLREQTDDKNGKQTEDKSRERGVESQPRAAAQRGYPEDAEDPMVAPPDFDIRQSGRVLELQNRDLWLRPEDMSWHLLPILMTIREEPFKNCRSRPSEKWKAKEDHPGNIGARTKRVSVLNGDHRGSWQSPFSWQ